MLSDRFISVSNSAIFFQRTSVTVILMCSVRKRTSLNNSDMFFQTKNQKENLCLDNNEYLFLGPEKLTVKDCNYEPETQVQNQMKKAGVNIVNGFLVRKLAVCFV